MKRGVALTASAVVVFGAIIIARLPATWVVPDASTGNGCAAVDGSIWSGLCTGLTIERQSIGDLTWEVHALRLLSGKLNADVVLTLPAGSAHGNLEVGLDRSLTARNVKADLPIDPALNPAIPPDLRGTFHADVASLQVEHHRVKSIQGRLEVHDVVQGTGDAAFRAGSYSVDFTGGNTTGRLRDLGGPLEVDGALKLTPEPGYDVRGQVRARNTAPPSLVEELRYLGSPDAQGRREFGLAGTF